jgi:organic hydroperoxide reductase OsmC/OhrA
VLNPEQLLVMAASSCQMLMFLHVAAKARIDVVEYKDEATGLMPQDREPTWITEITLRPRIVIDGDASEERVRKLLHTAHEHCFIANTLRSEMTIEPTVEARA